MISGEGLPVYGRYDAFGDLFVEYNVVLPSHISPALQTLTLALKWVQDVLDMKDHFDRIWSMSFQSDRELESGINGVRPVAVRFP